MKNAAIKLNSDPIEMATASVGWMGKAKKVITKMIDSKRSLNALGALSDAQLRDIGLVRDDLDTANQPGQLSDCIDELASAARSRAGNW